MARQDPAIYHTVLLHHVLLRIGPKLEEKEYLAIEAEDVRATILYGVSAPRARFIVKRIEAGRPKKKRKY